MLRFRLVLIILLVVAGLSQLGRLYAQDAPDEPGAMEPRVYLPAVIGGGSGGQMEGLPSHILVHLIHRSHEELEYFLAEDANSGTNNNSSCTATSKDKHLFYNYNVNLPGGVTVTGIEVRLDAFVDAVGSNAPRMCVQFSWDGGVTWTAAKQTPTLTTSEATYVLGGAADTWGRSWTTANLANTSFRVRVINVASGTNATARDFSLDWVAVRVNYQ